MQHVSQRAVGALVLALSACGPLRQDGIWEGRTNELGPAVDQDEPVTPPQQRFFVALAESGDGAGTPAPRRTPCQAHSLTEEASRLPHVAELPNPFVFANCRPIQSSLDWSERRGEIAEMAQHYEYGAVPPAPTALNASLVGDRIEISLQVDGTTARFDANVALPRGEGPFPAFIRLGLDADQDATKAAEFTERGYALIDLNAAPVAGDEPGRQGLFYDLHPGSTAGTLVAWAWAVHRVVDGAEQVAAIDASQIAVTGFSILGRAALLAGAFDERIALTVPSSSGLGGVGQFRFFYEDPSDANTANERLEDAWLDAPHRYARGFEQFVGQASLLPFDQHSVMALVAPRALLMTTGTADYWANPRGSRVSWEAAQAVYRFVNSPGTIGASWDSVGHELSPRHVAAMLDFADLQFRGVPSERPFHEMPAELPGEPAAYPWLAVPMIE